MATLGSFLAAAAGPLAKRAVAALGLGTVTFVGLDVATRQLVEAAQSAWGGLPADTLAVLAIAGFNSGLAIVSGALMTRVGLVALKRLAPV